MLLVNWYYTTGCSLDYPHFKENHKMIAIDLSKQQALDADPTATQQIFFFDRAGKATMFFIIEGAKEPWTFGRNCNCIVNVLYNNLFYLILYQYKTTQYNSLNVNLSNTQLSKLKSIIKNKPEVVSRLSSNMLGNSGDENSFQHKLLLTNRQAPNLRKAFSNTLSTEDFLVDF